MAESIIPNTLNEQIANLIKVKSANFTNLTISSSGLFALGKVGGTVIGIETNKTYYYCSVYKDSYNAWNGILKHAADDTRPTSGTVSGTYYYID